MQSLQLFISCFAVFSTIYLLTCLASTHTRTGFSFLCITVNGLTYGEWEISKMPFLIISSICSLTSRHNENGIGRLLHDLGNPPCIWNLYSNMLHLPYLVTSALGIYTGCNRRNGPDFGRVFIMLNYTENPQNTYVQSWTVWEIVAIENCGLPSGPRTIAVSWNSYLLVSLLAELRANDAPVKCVSFKVSSTRCGFLVSVW